MRAIVAVTGLLSLAACSAPSPDTARLTINDPTWERVNVEFVITNRADCDSRGEGFISTRQMIMRKNKTETIEAQGGATICWRHDRNPDKPVPGAWSGWTRATLFPGQNADADL